MKDAMMLRKGGGENVTPEVNQQVDIIDVLDEICMVTQKPKGKYLWLKFTNEDGAFIEAVVSDEADSFPVDATDEAGYYYMKVTDVLGIDRTGETFIFTIG